MKFELKTENEIFSKSFSNICKISFSIVLVIIFCDIALKLGIISRYYQIKNNCILLSVEKSTSYFNKLSNLSNLKSKQKIWEFCREVVK